MRLASDLTFDMIQSHKIQALYIDLIAFFMDGLDLVLDNFASL